MLDLKWKWALKRSRRPKVLVRRTGAMGDVVLVSGVLKHLVAAEFVDVFIVSEYWPLFEAFPGVVACHHRSEVNSKGFDRVINLDMVPEGDRSKPIVERYATVMLGGFSSAMDYRPRLYFRQTDIPVEWKNRAVIHALGTGWRNKLVAPEVYHSVEKLLTAQGIPSVFIGGQQDYGPSLPSSVDLRGVLSLRKLYWLLSGSRLFFGFDSGPMNLATATQLPIVALFTVLDPRNVIARPERTFPISTDAECRFCASRYVNCTAIPCWKETFECVKGFRLEVIEAEISKALNSNGAPTTLNSS